MPAPNVEEVQVPCSLFLGLNTEVAPPDLPEGVSPACQDVAFVPGNVFSRPCLHKVFPAKFPGNPTVVYQKTFDQPNADPLNFYLTSDGKFYFEEIFNFPNAYTLLGQVIAGLQAQSVTASGAEYLAFSNGLQGADVPRQVYRTPDGALQFDRVSQDGPGQSPTVTDFQQMLTASAIANGATFLGVTGGTQSGNVVTLTTTAPHPYYPGQIVFVWAMAVAGYNGLQTVDTVPSPTSLTYTLTATGLGASAGGFVQLPIATVVLPVGPITAPPQINVGDLIVINGTASGMDNNVAGNPRNWPVVDLVYATTRWTINFSFATAAPGLTFVAGHAGTVFLGGQSSPGSHQVVCMFLTRSGYLTAPSPPLSFISAGNTQWQITNLPIGPPNVVARVLGFTGAGGDNFFTITSSIQFPNPSSPTGTPVVVAATVVNDNTSTTAIIDTSDNALFGAQGIDIDGNNLFNQVVLGPCLFFFFYASRLIAAGMRNKLNNFLNMGFEGGYLSGVLTTPLGWTLSPLSAGGILVNGPAGYGQAWQITGDGTNAAKGTIQQPAFQDAYGIAIVKPQTRYSFRFYASTSGVVSGLLIADLVSASAGLLARAQFTPGIITAPGFYEADFSANLPAVIPADTVLQIYAKSMGAGQTVTLDELELIPTWNPYFPSFLISYVDNFEAFDGVSGVMGPSADPNPLRGCETIRDQLQFLTSGGMHQTADNGQEPATWQVSEISNDVGLVAFKALDAGEECIVFVSKSGGGNGVNPTYALRIFEGGQPWKISQEVQSIFDNINPAAEQTMWLVNDIGQRRMYIGVPTGTAFAPDVLYVLDYREIDTAAQIASNGSIHISFTGKMIASDLARKWTTWNIQANCGAMLARSSANVQFCLGAGNGVAYGGMAGFGNVYFLDPLKFTDDDYGVMSPFYVMYFFLSRDAETALGVGSMRKLYKGISEFISWIGTLAITPYAASLTNPWPGPPPIASLGVAPTQDLYHGLNVSTERMAVKFSVSPLIGTTDVQFNLQHVAVRIQQHPMSPFGTGASI